MEFFRFIFSSFWIWLGFTTIICIIGYYLVEPFYAAAPFFMFKSQGGQSMEIINKRVDELIEYEGNARRNDAGVAKVAESIKEFGFLNPITITPENVIISGHTRLKAAKLLGLEEVPCVVQNLSEEDAKLARIIDNKSHEYSTWDVGKLHQELAGIGMDFKTTFFTPNRDRKFFTENKFLIFGNNELPISEDEYNRLKAVYDAYIERNKTYLGFVLYLTGGKEE